MFRPRLTVPETWQSLLPTVAADNKGAGVDVIVVLVVLALVGWALSRHKSGSAAAAPPMQQSVRRQTAPPRSRPRQDPIKPHPLPGTSAPLSGRGRVSVVGEFYRQDGIEYVVAGRPVATGGNWDATLQARAALLPEPANPHDHNAVRVDLGSSDGWVTVGYLARERAVQYQPVLLRMVQAGLLPTAEGRICRAKGGPLAVYLHLAEADSCVLANQPLPGSRVLRPDRPCAVTGENKHQDVLEPLLTGDGRTQLWATLHPATVTSGKYAGEPTLEVRVDGKRVGALTTAQAERYVDQMPNEGVVCQAELARGAKNIEVKVFLPQPTPA
jgi:hypothetical protein